MNEWGKAKEKTKMEWLLEGTRDREGSLHSNKQLLMLKVSVDQDLDVALDQEGKARQQQ